MTKLKPKKSLKAGRPPPTATKTSSTLTSGLTNKPSKATRTIINKHHQLQKDLALARSKNDISRVSAIETQIAELGGLRAYQSASLTGQSAARGGDTSVQLVRWLKKYDVLTSTTTKQPSSTNGSTVRKCYRVLEIGSLSSRNAIAAYIGPTRGLETIRRIDLHSQEPGVIEQGDFMEMHIPGGYTEGFDIVSLSLVLNYVPSPAGRGRMLQRCREFLRFDSQTLESVDGQDMDEASDVGDHGTGDGDGDSIAIHEARKPLITSPSSMKGSPLPLLFIVLPLPCLSNSRYMTLEHFTQMVDSLGFSLFESHQSTKLVYLLFRLRRNWRDEVPLVFKKEELRKGAGRNNFAVTLSSQSSG